MQKILSVLSWHDIMFAACLAYIIHYALQYIKEKRSKNPTLKGMFDGKNLSMVEVYDKCKELFPIERLSFDGSVFTRGMRLRIITIQNKAIEGELIGVNDLDLVCIRTQNQIIVHQKEKIEEISVIA